MGNFIKRLKSSELGMRVLEKFYPTKKNDPEHYALIADAMNRYNLCTRKKTTSQIHREIQVCKKYWKCYPYHYFMYDLYRDDVKISDEELKKFIPHFFWYWLFLPHYHQPKYRILTNNKIILSTIFGSLKISQPETFFYFINGEIYTHEMANIPLDQIEFELSKKTADKIFLKPAEGSGGRGIIVFHKGDQGHYKTLQNSPLNREFIESIIKEENYIIQAGIKQVPEIAGIFSESTNTFRIITENHDGVVRIVCAILRIGRGKAEIDNISSGGICTDIDITNGKFGDFASSYAGERYKEHPDTHFKFQNFTLPRWNETAKFTTESAGKLPFFTYLGWDIALTADGPVAVEINTNPAIDGMEMVSSGLREAFGIDNPDFYWKNRGNRI